MEEHDKAGWLENAWENFQQAKDQGDITLAKVIIADTFDAGFSNEAHIMAVQLRSIN